MGSSAYLLPAVGGMVLGLGVAWLGAWRRWGVVTVTAVAVVVYVFLGGAFALPGTTIAGVLPGLETFRGLLLGAVTGWKEIVTSVPPLQSFPELGIVPFLLMFVSALVAGTVAWRVRDAQWALVPVLLSFVGVILLGTVIPAVPVVQGLVLVTVGLLWARGVRPSPASGAPGHHRGEHRRDPSPALAPRPGWRRGPGARRGGRDPAGAGGHAGHRADGPARERGAPLNLHEYVSPLASFRKYAKDKTDDELFTVEGLPAGSRVRLATLDAYNGVVYDVSSGGSGSGSGCSPVPATRSPRSRRGLRRTSRSRSGTTRACGCPTSALSPVSTTRAGAQRPWARPPTTTRPPGPGLPRRGSARATRSGSMRSWPRPSAEDLRSTRILQEKLPTSINVPDSVSAKAAQFMAEETDPVVQLENLTNGLIASGIFSSGLETQLPSRPGHSAERIDVLLGADEMVGDDEQFAVALALMAQSAGIPARVVMGFYPPETWEEGTPFVARGADVHAWVEVPFEGYGWVPVDAIPEEDNKIKPEPKSDQVPKPPVLEDPEPPEEPADAEAGKVDDEEKKDDAESSGFDWGLAAVVVVSVVVPLAILALPLLLILLLKSRRRRRRREAERTVDRISGGWREVLDVATDLGAPVAPGPPGVRARARCRRRSRRQRRRP
ncbi:transglutaminase-like domain-containing protein [Oerskovia sp. M15]